MSNTKNLFKKRVISVAVAGLMAGQVVQSARASTNTLTNNLGAAGVTGTVVGGGNNKYDNMFTQVNLGDPDGTYTATRVISSGTSTNTLLLGITGDINNIDTRIDDKLGLSMGTVAGVMNYGTSTGTTTSKHRVMVKTSTNVNIKDTTVTKNGGSLNATGFGIASISGEVGIGAFALRTNHQSTHGPSTSNVSNNTTLGLDYVTIDGRNSRFMQSSVVNGVEVTDEATSELNTNGLDVEVSHYTDDGLGNPNSVVDTNSDFDQTANDIFAGVYDNEAGTSGELDLTTSSASLMVDNGSASHGLQIDVVPGQTTLSGGTSSTTLTLDNAGAHLDNVLDMGGNQINNVADGAVNATSTDAVNGRQLDAEKSSRVAADNAEGSTRAAADVTLQNNINAEGSTRAAADVAETSSRTAADNAEGSTRAAAVNAEGSTRAAADTTLTNNLNAEGSTRAAAIISEASSRTAADNAEGSTRAAADNAEGSTRAAADTTLTTNLAAEVSNRVVAVNAEGSTRASADVTLQNNINAEGSTRASAVSAEATTRANADNAEGSTRASADVALQNNIDANAAADAQETAQRKNADRHLNNRVDDVEGGVAAAIALTSAQQPSAVGKTAVSIGAGFYAGENAIGINAVHKLANNGNVGVGLAQSTSSNGDLAAKVSYGFEF